MSDKKAEPMDPSAREVDTAEAHVNAPRKAGALRTLVAEVLDLFPETPHEFSEVNGRNTALAVTFDVTNLDLDDRDTFASLLALAKGTDDRIEEVTVEEQDALVNVRIVNNPRIHDGREEYALADILADMGNDVTVAAQTVPVTEGDLLTAPGDPASPAPFEADYSDELTEVEDYDGEPDALTEQNDEDQ